MDNTIQDFLEEAAEQIAYKPLRPAIMKELGDHIEDRMEEYESEGLSHEDAEQKALTAMGDAVAIGTELNAVRHVRSNPVLAILTLALLTAGFSVSAFLRWTPEQYANGFLYYIPGLALLILTAYAGYPLLVKYWRPLLRLSMLLYGIEIICYLISRYVPPSNYLFYPLNHIFGFYSLLLLGPLLAIALYSQRKHGKNAILTVLALSAVYILLRISFNQYTAMTSSLIFMVSLISTIWSMCRCAVFSGSKKILCRISAIGGALLLALFALAPGQVGLAAAFSSPETVVYDTWDDTYNSLLIKELLSRTPMTEGISLTSQELMEYGTGAWYFGPVLPERKIYIHYTPDNVTLWDILPQHFHNNYIIAVSILLYGWIPGLLFLAVIAGFYGFLFRCIRRIRGQLAGAVSLCCGICLLMQSILYVLGNFGFQYATFSTLPLISEGRISIMVNALLLGFIFSAYRYDRVIEFNVTSSDSEPLKQIKAAVNS